MIKSFKYKIITILICSFFYSCSNKKSAYYNYGVQPIFDYAYKKKNLNNKDLKAFDDLSQKKERIEGNLNYKILTTILSDKSNLNIKSSIGQDLIGRLTKSFLILDTTPNLKQQADYIKKKSMNKDADISLNQLSLPKKFLSFIPSSNNPFKLEWIESSDSYNYVNATSHYYHVKKKYLQKKHYCRTEKVFGVNSNNFPNKFYFPQDFLSSQTLCPVSIDYLNELDTITREKKFKEKFYLTLMLPKVLELPILTNYKYLNLIQKENFGKTEVDKAKSLKDFYDHNFDKYQFVFSKTKLLLEPAFEAYKGNIKYIWDLFLLKVSYQNLSDTFKLSGSEIYSSLQFILPQIQLTDTLGGFYHNDQYFIIRNYLEQNFNHQQEIYKSYFELVLWKMYECSEFTLNRKEYEKASFTFTSNNPKYPGNYEVFFSIYEPNLFKVKKRG